LVIEAIVRRLVGDTFNVITRPEFLSCETVATGLKVIYSTDVSPKQIL